MSISWRVSIWSDVKAIGTSNRLFLPSLANPFMASFVWGPNHFLGPTFDCQTRRYGHLNSSSSITLWTVALTSWMPWWWDNAIFVCSWQRIRAESCRYRLSMLSGVFRHWPGAVRLLRDWFEYQLRHLLADCNSFEFLSHVDERCNKQYISGFAQYNRFCVHQLTLLWQFIRENISEDQSVRNETLYNQHQWPPCSGYAIVQWYHSIIHIYSVQRVYKYRYRSWQLHQVDSLIYNRLWNSQKIRD